jgi:hypothetical protein
MFTLFPARPFTETSIEFRFVERPDYTKARAVYKDFLTLWKNADLDSPQPEAGQSRVRQVAIEPCVLYPALSLPPEDNMSMQADPETSSKSANDSARCGNQETSADA